MLLEPSWYFSYTLNSFKELNSGGQKHFINETWPLLEPLHVHDDVRQYK